MAEAFFYMLVVGMGATSGAAIVGIVTWRLVLKIQNKENKKMKKKGAAY